MDRRGFIEKSAFALLSSLVLSNRLMAKVIGNSAMSDKKQSSSKNKKPMKIVVLTGSPRKSGNSAHLAEQFIKGAEEAGHSVFRFDAAFEKVNGCTACNRCGMDGDCVFKDDFEKLRPHLISADMVVFATPMYYFGISAQLKAVIDRFYALNGKIKGAKKKAAYLMTYADTNPKEAEAMLSHYDTLIHYLGWDSVGSVVAPGVWTAGSVKDTPYPAKAYQLGKNV